MWMITTRGFTRGVESGWLMRALIVIPWLKSPGLGRETAGPGQESVFLPKLNGKRLHAGHIAESIPGEMALQTGQRPNSTRDTTRPLRWTVFPKGQAPTGFWILLGMPGNG